jgi:hypothetical protein
MKLTANDIDIANLEHPAERHHALSAFPDKAAGRTRLSSGR